jgi:hypothetical protein
MYVVGATPAVESASLQFWPVNFPEFLEGAPIEIAHSTLKPLTLLRFFFDCEFFREPFFTLKKKNWM